MNKKKLSEEEKDLLTLERGNLIYFDEVLAKFNNIYRDNKNE